MYGFHYFPIVADLLLIIGGGLLSGFFLFVKKQGRHLGSSMMKQMTDKNAAHDAAKLLNKLCRRLTELGIFIILLGILNLAGDCLGGSSIIKTITCCLLFVGFIVYGIVAGQILQKISNALKSKETAP